ncbi:hypothetical protein GQ53DRAFT_674429 [Thozetella sp. PMI_491]|nr:hypothetical protein GQ53DRAFT_674429 [Thozetella sp. PMI_491]
MKAAAAIQSVVPSLLAQKSLRLVSWEPIQALWAGYGHICRVLATPELSNVSTALESQSWILKFIAPPPARNGDEGHARKILSYHVEQFFYTQLAAQMPADIPVAACLASTIPGSGNSGTDQGDGTAMLLTDLSAAFPVAGERRGELSQVQVHAALDWLAGFHGFWWTRTAEFELEALVRPPLEEMQRRGGRHGPAGSVWLNGGYTYLATRRTEYASLEEDEESEWCDAMCVPSTKGGLSIAEKVAKVLAPRSDRAGPIADYQTLIHGDVKSENLFTTAAGDQVAFYDFQYVGLGAGVCDLAKLFTCSVPLRMLVENRAVPDDLGMQQGEKELLQRYQRRVEKLSEKSYPWDTLVRHWETALVDWLRFQASWGFWGNTEWLEARGRHILNDVGWNRWLDSKLD